MSDPENRENENNLDEVYEDNFNLDNTGNLKDVNESIIEEGNEGEGDNDNSESNTKENNKEFNDLEENRAEESDEDDDNDDLKKKKKKKVDDDNDDDDEGKKKIFDKAFYDITELKPKQELKQVSDSNFEIVYIFGFESEKLNNLYFLNETNFISAIGNYVYIVNINSLKHKYIPGIKNGGIGAIAVHPNMSYFAIAEKVENNPFIYIYEYPSCQLHRILRNGSVKGYNALCFNNEGTRLASVGSEPDYTLTIWDWKQENVILRSKAFSQDVYRVEFLKENDQILTTSGMGHIKFWNISNTFTGLKLQGNLGKFGIVELSDISTFLHLSDGKVLSSSETGYLLLWEGGLIKCVISRPGGKPCHNGKIFVLLSEEGEVYSSGEDGFIRIWDFENLDNADVSFDLNQNGNKKQVNAYQVQIPMFEIDPLDEINLGKNIRVNNMIKLIGSQNEFLIQDGSGTLFKLDIKTRSMFNVMRFHSKEVVGVVSNPINHTITSLGDDGSIKLYDYINSRIIGSASYSGNGTVLRMLPRTLDPKCNTYVAGYNDGVIKFIKYVQDEEENQNKFVITHISKPHATSISSLEISPDGRYLVSTAVDRTLFLYYINLNEDFVKNMESTINIKNRFEIIQSENFVFSSKTINLIPLGFIELHLNVINMSWSPDNHCCQNLIDDYISFDVSDKKSEKDIKNEKFWEYNNLYDTLSCLSKNKLLIVLENGTIYEITTPQLNEIDNTLTFQLKPEQLNFKEWVLEIAKAKDIKFILNKKEDEKKNESSEDEKNEDNVFDVLDNINEEEKEINNELIKHYESCLQGAKIVGILYLPGGYFLINFVLNDGKGQIRSCHYDSPNQSRIIFTYPKRIVYMSISNSRQYLLFGISDGSVIQYKFDYTDVILTHDHMYHEELDTKVLEYLQSDESTFYVDNFDQIEGKITNKLNERNKEDMNSNNDDNNSNNNDDNNGNNNDDNNGNNNDDNNGNNNNVNNDNKNRNKNNNSDNNINNNKTNINIGNQQDTSSNKNSKPSNQDLNELQFTHGHYFKANLHDNKNGNITGIALSYDDSYMISCGSDGAIFVFRNKYEQKLDDEDEKIDMNDNVVIDDIIDKNCYSLQEAKIKNDRDKELANAEIKKNETRSKINELREEFLEILAENDKAENNFKVDRELFKIDINLQESHEMERKKSLVEIEKEFAWINEKEELGLNKIKSKFLDPIKTEKIVITSFNTHQKVSTFRTKKIELIMDASMKNDTYNNLNGEKNENNYNNYNDNNNNAIIDDNNQSNENESFKRNELENKQNEKKNEQIIDNNHEIKTREVKEISVDTKNKNELRKQERARRAILYKELLNQKPDPSTNDPKDEALIELAMATIGDFKLKTSEKYIVPENERINAEKKQRQIYMLARSIYELKEQFNKHVLNLKARKENIIELIKEKKKIIDLIDMELNILNDLDEEPIIIPELDIEGYPERRYEVTDGDIEEFKEILEERKKKALQINDEEDDGIGGFNATGPVKPKESEKDSNIKEEKRNNTNINKNNKDKTPNKELLAQKWKENYDIKRKYLEENGIIIITMLENIEFNGINIIELSKLLNSIKKTKLEVEENDNLKSYFKYLRKEICDDIADIKNKFDETFNILFSEHILLEGDIKFAEIRLILFYDEWVLLKEFQNHEAVLSKKLYNKKKEKLEIESKIKECQDKLLGKKGEIENIILIEKNIQKRFNELVNGNKYEEMLTKIFKKKIKRSRKKNSDNDEDNDDSDESSSESDSDFDSDEDFSESDENSIIEEEIEEICPEDLEQEIFDTVLSLRLEQSDQEYNISEIQKIIDALKKENEGYLKKEKIIDSALKGFESDIQAFQTLKQKKLNELDVVVPLKLNQIQYLNGQSVPSDLSAALVFQNEEVKRLKLRIKELHQEKADIRKQHRELRKMHNNLIINKKEKLARIVELEKKAYDVQMLKFGQIIDLEKLERMGVNKNAEDLKEKLNKKENKYSIELNNWDKKVQMNKQQLTAVTIENTKKINTYLDLKKLYNKLENSLTSAQATMTTVYNDEDNQNNTEKEKLLNLVNDQRNEIEELKREIEILMCKPNRSPLLKRVKRLNNTVSSTTRKIPLPPRENRLNSILSRTKIQKMEHDKLKEIMVEIKHPIIEEDYNQIEIATNNNINNKNQQSPITEENSKEHVITENIEVNTIITEKPNVESLSVHLSSLNNKNKNEKMIYSGSMPQSLIDKTEETLNERATEIDQSDSEINDLTLEKREITSMMDNILNEVSKNQVVSNEIAKSDMAPESETILELNKNNKNNDKNNEEQINNENSEEQINNENNNENKEQINNENKNENENEEEQINNENKNENENEEEQINNENKNENENEEEQINNENKNENENEEEQINNENTNENKNEEEQINNENKNENENEEEQINNENKNKEEQINNENKNENKNEEEQIYNENENENEEEQINETKYL